MALFSKILNKFRGGSVSAADWDEFESALIESDLGGKLAQEIIALAKSGRPDDIEAELLESLRTKMSKAPRTIEIHSGRTTTILVVGVNGTGKTTSVAKLMKYFKDQHLRCCRCRRYLSSCRYRSDSNLGCTPRCSSCRG